MKRLVKVSLILTAMAVLLSSCNCYKKMQKNVGDIQVRVTPEVLVLRGNEITADVTVTFPKKYFYEETILRVTPVLVFQGGEIAGTPKYLQGDKVKDNYTVISWKNGGSYTQTVTFPYDPRADLSTLELRIDSKCGDQCRKKWREFSRFATIQAAQGVSNLQAGIDYTQYMTIMPDNYSRVTTMTETADIHYVVSSSVVRPAELTKEQIRMFEEFVRDNANRNDVTLGTVHAKGYASPEGPENFNDKLSRDRSISGENAIKKNLSDVNVRYDAAAYGEDWEGFKALVEQSNIKDRDLILQVLQMYNSPVQREREIKNMAAVYQVLKTDILPQLRRTQLVATVDRDGLNDQQILASALRGDRNISVEEILYAATLTNDKAEKVRIYEHAANTYGDVRAYNNYGVALAQTGDYQGAKRAFQRAAGIRSSQEISNNLAALAIAEGNYNEARQYLSALNSTDSRRNKGLLAIADGDYTAAARELDGYNKAIAEVLNGNLASAKSAIANDQSADAEYLRAVIASREGDTSGANAYLRSAISKNPELRAKAMKDVEFAKMFGTSDFLTL